MASKKEKEKVVVEIDPISKPLEYAEKAGKAIVDGTKKTVKKVKNLFKF